MEERVDYLLASWFQVSGERNGERVWLAPSRGDLYGLNHRFTERPEDADRYGSARAARDAAAGAGLTHITVSHVEMRGVALR